jgi:nucleoid DNA-binding protein
VATVKDLARALAEEMKLSQAKAREFLEKALDGITQRLLTKGRIRLGSFGIFEVRIRKARTARNPRTGAKLPVPPRAVVAFKPSAEMRERIAQMKEIPQEGSSTPPPAAPAAPPSAPAPPPDTTAAPPSQP